MLRTRIGVVCLIILCMGCTPQYTQQLSRQMLDLAPFTGESTVQRHNQWLISHNSRIFLAYPAGSVGGAVKRQLLQALTLSLTEQVWRVSLSENEQATTRQWLSEANKMGSTYLVQAEVLAFDDQPTDGSASFFKTDRDVIHVKFNLWDVASRKQVDTVVITQSASVLASRKHSPLTLLSAVTDSYTKALIYPPSNELSWQR